MPPNQGSNEGYTSGRHAQHEGLVLGVAWGRYWIRQSGVQVVSLQAVESRPRVDCHVANTSGDRFAC